MTRSASVGRARVFDFSGVFSGTFFGTFSGVLAFALILVSSAPIGAEDAEDAEDAAAIGLIYAESNVGGSSGGHTAVEIEGTVYHYQRFSDSLFRLVRDRSRVFRRRYGVLQNRPLHIAWITVESRVMHRVRARFDHLYVVQEATLDVFRSFGKERRLIERSASPDPQITLRGAGLLSEESAGDRRGALLRRRIEQDYGAGFLSDALRKVSLEIAETPLAASVFRRESLSLDRLPNVAVGSGTRLEERLLLREALEALFAGCAPPRDALLTPGPMTGIDSHLGLSPTETDHLKRFAEKLEDTVIELLASNRPDRAFPLCLAMARYHAARRSVDEGRLHVLDPFPSGSAVLNVSGLPDGMIDLARASERARRIYVDARRRVFEREELTERDYMILESTAARAAELRAGVDDSRPVRVHEGPLIPCRARKVSFRPSRSVDPEGSLARAVENEAAALARLRELYPYDLISRNCVTELVRSLNSSFDTSEAAAHALGGRLTPDEGLTFIPFVFFGKACARFRVGSIERLPSYRERRLEGMYASEAAVPVFLRECNVVTSSVYRRQLEDGPFVFFTDDFVWTRPIFGAVNLACGVFHVGTGVFTLAFDGGDRMLAGGRGAFFSLPELAFFNIRKGTFSGELESR